MIFQTQITWSNRIHSLKYLRSATFGSKDIVIRKSEFVAKTQFLLRHTMCDNWKLTFMSMSMETNVFQEDVHYSTTYRDGK